MNTLEPRHDGSRLLPGRRGNIRLLQPLRNYFTRSQQIMSIPAKAGTHLSAGVTPLEAAQAHKTLKIGYLRSAAPKPKRHLSLDPRMPWRQLYGYGPEATQWNRGNIPVESGKASAQIGKARRLLFKDGDAVRTEPAFKTSDPLEARKCVPHSLQQQC